MIDIEKMAKEHEALFPLADLDSQLEKFEEETNEIHEAMNHLIEEIADRIIVGCGIYRFDKRLAAGDLNICYAIGKRFNILDAIEEEVNRKWQINLKRKWVWNGKTYHHVEENS